RRFLCFSQQRSLRGEIEILGELLCDRRTTTLEFRQTRKPVVVLAFSLCFARSFSLRLLKRPLNGFVIKAAMSGEIGVFAREHGALQVGRNLVQRYPNLFTSRLLTIRFRFASTCIDQ